ncbi:hypothetical protein V5O48_011554 [Marasmius crinis-equi]|uniref:MARVEL domain-containing protein n=1 Tax=Marasmius crinis-equi TaxID=585013 RepID=A0ABR3F567_9AGAR
MDARTTPYGPGAPAVVYAPVAPSTPYAPGTSNVPFYMTGGPVVAPYTIVVPPPYGSSDKMPPPAAARTAIYSLVIVFGVAANAIAPIALVTWFFLDVFIPTINAGMAFTGIATLCSLFTWIWASVLLSYNRRLYATDAITRASAHCISTMVLSIAWLVIAIALFAITGTSCTSEDLAFFALCQFNLSLAVLALCLSILLGSVSLLIFMRTRNNRAQLAAVNVAQFDGDSPQQPMQLMPMTMQPFGHGHQVQVQDGGLKPESEHRSGPSSV